MPPVDLVRKGGAMGAASQGSVTCAGVGRCWLEDVPTISVALFDDGADCTEICDQELRLEPATGQLVSDRHA